MAARVTTRDDGRRGRAAGLLLIFSALGGCDVVTSVGPQSCDFERADNPPTTFSGGTVEDDVYMSSPWDSDLVFFPGGMQVRMEHHLGQAPRTWTAYVSFNRDGLRDGGSMAPAAGNQVELVGMDDVAMTFRNSTCADYYLLITAQAGSAPVPTPAGDSPVDG